MKKVYLVYKTDFQHIGITTSPIRAVNICIRQAKKEGERIGKQQLFNLKNMQQTQGYSGNGEFQFESVILNTLL